MIDLTPLDVRNKRGDFKKLMRGYDPAEVDVFLELAAERLEVLVRENLQLRERTQTLQNQVDAQVGREQAVQDALVTAQELRADIQTQSQREADHVLREATADAKRKVAEAEAEARRVIAEAEAEVRSRLRGIDRQLDNAQDSMTDLERRRVRFLKEFRGLLERELDVVNVEEDRVPFEERAIDLDLGPRTGLAAAAPRVEVSGSEAPEVEALEVEAPGVEVPEAEALEAEVPEAEAPEAWAPEAKAPETETPEASPPDDTPASEGDVVAEVDMAALLPDIIPADEVDAAPEEGAADVAVAGRVEVASVTEPQVTELPAVAEMNGVPEAQAPAIMPDDAADAIDVSTLGPEPVELPDEPTTLELELMAGAASAAADSREQYRDVPDLETLLAEAGVEELKPTVEKDIAPPPPPGIASDNLILFDPNDPDRKR